MPFPANTSLICIKLSLRLNLLVLHLKIPSFVVGLAYFSNNFIIFFCEMLISVVISFAVLTLY